VAYYYLAGVVVVFRGSRIGSWFDVVHFRQLLTTVAGSDAGSGTPGGTPSTTPTPSAATGGLPEQRRLLQSELQQTYRKWTARLRDLILNVPKKVLFLGR
jgi:hypothetical protein